MSKMINIKLKDEIAITVRERIEAKLKRRGIKDPLREVIQGHEWFRKQRKWVIKCRDIDREHDRYVESVTDEKSGEVIHKTDEPLSNHRGHGSAKQKQ